MKSDKPKMFLATIFAVTKFYSNKTQAEKSLAAFINSRMKIHTVYDVRSCEEIKLSFAREQYGEVISKYNHYVAININGSSIHQATITECELDGKF